MKEILNQLAQDIDIKVPRPLRYVFFSPNRKEKCNEILHFLVEDSTPLKNTDFYHCVELYLYNQVFDCEPLTEDEEVLTHHFSTIDQDKILKVKVTSELLDRVACEDKNLTDDEWKSVELYLNMLLTDGIQPDSHEIKAIDKCFPEDEDIDTHGEVIASKKEEMKLIYGYNIFDIREVIKVIEKNHEQLIPFSKREVRLIKQLHDLDPYSDPNIPF